MHRLHVPACLLSQFYSFEIIFHMFPRERKKRERSRRDLSKVDDESFSCLVDFYDMHNVVRVFLRESLKRREQKEKELAIYLASERDKPSTWG